MMNNLSIRNKIWIAISIPLAVTIIATIVFAVQISSIVAKMDNTIHDQGMKSLDLILNADRDMYQALNAIQELNVVDKADPKYEELLKDFRDNTSQVNERISEAKKVLEMNSELWGQYAHEKSGHKVFESFSDINQTFAQWVNTSENIIKSGKIDTIYSTTFLKDFDTSREFMNDIGELVGLSINEQVEASVKQKNQAILTIIIINLIGFLAALTISFKINGSINHALKKAVNMITELGKGHLNVRADIKTHDEIGQMTDMMNQFADHLQMNIVGNMKKISEGDLNTSIQIIDEKDEIGPALKTTIESLKELVNETQKLTQSAVNGHLSARGDAGKLKGAYAQIIQGMNQTLDSVIEPVQEAAAVLNELSKGNLKKSVQGDYKGDHAQIKNAVNDTISTLSSYIYEISSILNEIANGNLNVEINKDYKGDFFEIKHSLNLIINSLNEMLADINGAASQVASGAKQVAASSQALSQGSTEQAGSIQELTASMEQIAAQTKQNAINANQANELATSAKDHASQGNQQMLEMLKAMDEINEASASISKIIKVIDEIAFQTNILALNAAVEAARAGQHGKGFAVVAEEVRNLAARSASAAKETTVLIEGSIKKVEGGTKIANTTADALTKIVNGVSTAASLVGNIAVASNEQATGIAQVNQGILQVSQVTQTNSATSEQGAAASEELSSQAELLKEQVSRFKLKKSGKNYQSLEGLSPDVIKMIENAADNKSNINKSSIDASTRLKINLGDRDFGKY